MNERTELESFLDVFLGPTGCEQREKAEVCARMVMAVDPSVVQAAGLPSSEIIKRYIEILEALPKDSGTWESVKTMGRCVGMVLARLDRLRAQVH